MRRPDHAALGADRAQIGQRGAVTGQQEVIAVVDREPALRVVVGAAAPASLLQRLVHDHALAASCEANRSREAGKAGADDVDGARHQMNA